jgi:hypothetical protein
MTTRKTEAMGRGRGKGNSKGNGKGNGKGKATARATATATATTQQIPYGDDNQKNRGNCKSPFGDDKQ